MEIAVLGLGCFWGAERIFWSLEGVNATAVGYMGGYTSYREITKFVNKFNPMNHAEVVEVTFNKNIISAEKLVKHFFESHDPTQLNRQGNDIGTQYRSVVLYTNSTQKETAERLSSEYQSLLNNAGYEEVETKIKPLQKFYKAENYHQDYIAKNPNGYCPDHSTGIKFSKSKLVKKKSNDALWLVKV